MGVNRLDHAAILVRDVGEALVWYADVLGLKALERAGDHAHLSCGGDHADLTLVAGGHGPVSFAIGVDDEDDLAEVEPDSTAMG